MKSGETCWRCRPGFSPATGLKQSAGDRLSAPPDVGPSCSSAPLAWGSSCRAWRWTLGDNTQADTLAVAVQRWQGFLCGERTDLLLLKRLLDLLQVGQQADVRADLQADQNTCAQMSMAARGYESISRCASSFCSSPCGQSPPNWPGRTGSRCPPYGCTSVRSPGRTCRTRDKRIKATGKTKHTRNSLKAQSLYRRTYFLKEAISVTNLSSSSTFIKI